MDPMGSEIFFFLFSFHNDAGVGGGKAWKHGKTLMQPHFFKQPSTFVTRKSLRSCPPHLRRQKPASFPLPPPSFWGSGPVQLLRPKGTDFPSSEAHPSPNLEALPWRAPCPFFCPLRASGHVSAPALGCPTRGRGPSARKLRGLWGAGDKEAAAPLRPPGPSSRGQRCTPTHWLAPPPPPPPPHRWLRSPGSRARRCYSQTNNGKRRRRSPKLQSSAAPEPAGCWQTD